MNRLQKLAMWMPWKLFQFGQEAVAEEVASLFTERAIHAKRHGLKVTLENLEYADQLATQGERDEAKAACIEAFKASLVGMAEARSRPLLPMTEEEVSESLAAPFVGALSSATPSASGPKAIEQSRSTSDAETNGTTPEPPVRRGPGRPAGVKDSKPRRTAKRLAAESSDVTEPEASSEQS